MNPPAPVTRTLDMRAVLARALHAENPPRSSLAACEERGKTVSFPSLTRFTAPYRVKALRLTVWACALCWATVTGCASAPSPGPAERDDEHQHSVSSPIIGGYLDTATKGVVALA